MENPPFPLPAIASGELSLGLEELLAVAGESLGEEVSPRTVRLYASQGLIDRPGKEGRHAVYGRRHLLQLLLIRSLARRGLSLSAIAPLCGLADGAIEQQLASLASPEAPNPALAYLQELESTATPVPMALLGAPLPPAASPASPRFSTRSSGSRSAASRWHRFSLSPGVELHISDAVALPPSGERRRHWVQRLADRLLQQLDEHSG